MTSLLSLPNELISEVIAYLQFDRKVLLHVSSVNRRLHANCQQFLFRYADNVSSEQQTHLRRSLDENPELKKAVWFYGSVLITARGFIAQEDFLAVSTLPKLKKLTLEACHHLPGPYSSQKSIFKAKNLGGIEDICVQAPKDPRIWVPGALLNTFKVMPTIRTLTVANLGRRMTRLVPLAYTERWIDPDFPTTPKSLNASGITTLRLIGLEQEIPLDNVWIHNARLPRQHFYARSLYEFHRHCTSLQTLQCTNLFVVCDDDAHQMIKTERRGLQSALNHVSRTLQDLTLTVTDNHSSGWDGEDLDLSDFTTLKRLHVGAGFIMAKPLCISTRETLYERLPPPLEILQIDFGSISGIFYSHLYERKLHYHTEFDAGRSAWLSHFPTQKDQYFANLRKVTLLDPTPVTPHRMSRWTPPAELDRMLTESNVELDVWLCVHTGKHALWRKPTIVSL